MLLTLNFMLTKYKIKMSHFKLMLALAVFYTSTQSIGGAQYHQLVENLHSCQNDACYPNRSEDFNSTTCACDSQCSKYKDCCYNAEVDSIYHRNEYDVGCISKSADSLVGVLAINRCPIDWTSSRQRESHRRCSGENDLSYPAVSIPVTNTITNITYRNAFCAACYNESPENLVLWDVKITCEGLESRYSLGERDLEYDPEQKTWGVRIDSIGPLYPCQLVFQPPPSLENALRPCLIGLVDTCFQGSNSFQVSECSSYTARVYSTSGVAYRNPHCAACNNVHSDDLRCEPQHVIATTTTSEQNSFQSVISLNSREDIHMIGGNTHCQDEKRFDPFFDRCRDPFLAVRGYDMVDEGR